MKIVVIIGPTGVGKTKLSISLAKRMNAVVMNADSMQVYKELNIGTAKIKESEKGEKNMKKVTKRDYYHDMLTLVIAAEDAGFPYYNYEGLRGFINNECELLERKAEAAKARAQKQKEEADLLTNQIYDVLNAEEFMTIPQIVAQLGDDTLSSQKVASRLGKLINANKVEKTEVPAGKGRKINGYKTV